MWLSSQNFVLVAAVLFGVDGAPTDAKSNNENAMVSLKIQIPDSTEVVETDVAADSTIPACVKRDAKTLDTDGILLVSADIFTECARGELHRIQDELSKPMEGSSVNRGHKAEKMTDSRDNKPSTTTPSPDDVESSIRDVEKVDKNILAQHGLSKEKSSNSTADIVKAVGSSQDLMGVFQTVFDYKRVVNDLKRILRGDVFGVLGEYPGRMNGLFKMVQELPKRILRSLGIVNRLRTDTSDTTFRGMLTNLRDYLTQASQTAKALPDAFNMIRVIETLKNVASKIGGRRQGEEPVSQRALLSRVEQIITYPVREIQTINARIGSSSELLQRPFRLIPEFLRHHPSPNVPRSEDAPK